MTAVYVAAADGLTGVVRAALLVSFCVVPDAITRAQPRTIPLRAWLVRLAAALCCLASALPALAVPPPASPGYIIDVWETDQGLPENSATAMVQAPDGYLWFGTFNGLVRFDGVRFTVLDSSNTPQLPSAAIVNLHLDRTGRLWISTDQGLVSVKDGRWTNVGPETGWVGDYVRVFAEGRAGQMYFSTFDRRLLQLRGNRVEEIPSPVAGDALDRGGYPYVDESGDLWLLHPTFVGRWSGSRWERSTALYASPDGDLVGAGVGRDGGLWVLGQRRLVKYRGRAVVFEASLPEPVVGFWNLTEDASGTVWIASFTTGLYRYSPAAGWFHFTTANGLSYNSTRFVFEDRENNLWVGTSGGGLLRLKPRTFANWGLAEGLPERVLKSVAEFRGGDLVVGTHGRGVVRLDGTPVLKGSWGPAYVQATLVDRHNRLWVGFYGQGLHQLGAVDTAKGVLSLPDQDGNWSVYSLFEDSKGRLWAGGDRGASVHEDGRVTVVALPGEHSIRSLAEDPLSGAMWAGTASAGLYRLTHGGFERVAEARDLAATGISALHADADGTLWIGTFDKGLAALVRGRLHRIGEGEGLPARGIGAILDDGLGYLWLGTNRGVLRVARSELRAVVDGRQRVLSVRLFGRGDGLASVECPVGYQPTAIKDARGRLWFATLKGVASVDPGALRVNTVLPNVLIDEVRIDDRLVSGARQQPFVWGATKTVTVPAGSQRVEVHYTALSLTAPDQVRFMYRIDGLDADWVDAGTRRVAYLQDLAPGDYAFRVKAANNDGLWNQTGAVFALTVQPFWWQTLWFRLAAMIGVAGGIGLLGWQGSRFALRRQMERQTHARALEQERARLASVLDATSDCVAFADPDGRLLYLNPAGRLILGFDKTTPLVGRTLADLHPPAAAARVMAEAVPAAIRDGLWSGETTVVGTGGAEVPVSQVIAAHRSPSGEVEFLSTIARDLSDRVRAEQQLLASEERLRQSQKMEAVGRLAGGIAHDFNNLLTVITGYTSLLLERHRPEEPDYAPIEETHKAAERAADLTRQLLAFSRKQVLTRTALDLNVVVENVENMLRPLIGEHIELVTTLAPDLGLVRADRGQVEQVLVNLAVNARDAMPDGGRLTLTTASVTLGEQHAQANPEVVPGDYVLLSVTDTGRGMEPAVRDRIFEPFYTTKGAAGGTGLGLATVYGIVRQSGGYIEVVTDVGCGTTFKVYLPRDVAATTEAPRALGSMGVPRGDEVVLLVEDEPSVRNIARVVLQRNGYTVLDARDPAHALHLAATYTGRIDLLVTDVVMPQMNGRELASQLSSHRPGTKVLYVSGYTDDAILRHGVLDADVAFLQKPFTPDALARKVRDVLDGATP